MVFVFFNFFKKEQLLKIDKHFRTIFNLHKLLSLRSNFSLLLILN